MSKSNKEYEEALSRKVKNAEKVISAATPMGAWSYGFHDGWKEALASKFDDRKALASWRQASKHVLCPCTDENTCDKNCPHANSFMSGVCKWCIEAYKKIEKEEK